MATRQWQAGFWTVFCLFLLAAPAAALAAPNATIVNGNVQLRQSYPKFGVSTFLKFRLDPGPVLAIIPNNRRVEITRKRTVSKTQEWFETKFIDGSRTWTGWIYGGQAGGTRYVRFDPGVERKIPVAKAGAGPAAIEVLADAGWPSFVGAALAQPATESVAPPPAETDPFRTLALGLAYVVIFIVSLVATRRWIFPNSNAYSFLTGCCVMVILGFLSETALADIFASLAGG